MASREERNKDIQEELEKKEKHERTIKIFKIITKLFLIFLITFLSIFFYTKYISTMRIIVKEERIKNEKIPSSFEGIKIVHFSDLYYGTTIYKEELHKLIKIINLRKPDIVIFTGNLVDKNYNMNTKEQEEMINELKKIKSTIGMYAVTGRNDNKNYSTIMNQSGFKLLDNNYDIVYNYDNSPILLVGLSSLLQDKRNIDDAYKYFKEKSHNSNIYTISIMNETDDLDDILSLYNNDLVLAGNSLNGQISIPGIGGIIKQKGSSKYVNAYYEKNKTRIYVSSGIGSPDIGFRFFSRPSINFFRLSKK